MFGKLFKGKNHKPSFEEGAELKSKIDSIIHELRNVQQSVVDSNKKRDIEDIINKLNEASCSKLNNYGNSLEIFKMVEASISDMTPIISFYNSGLNNQLRFVCDLLDDYRRGDSIYLDKKFKDLYKYRRDLLSSISVAELRKKQLEENKVRTARDALAANERGDRIGYSRYMAEIKNIEAQIIQYFTIVEQGIKKFQIIDAAVAHVVEAKSTSQGVTITDMTSKIIEDALSKIDKNTYQDYSKQEKTAKTIRSTRERIDKRYDSSDTIVGAMDESMNQSYIGRELQKANDNEVIMGSHDIASSDELEALKKIIEGSNK